MHFSLSSLSHPTFFSLSLSLITSMVPHASINLLLLHMPNIDLKFQSTYATALFPFPLSRCLCPLPLVKLARCHGDSTGSNGRGDVRSQIGVARAVAGSAHGCPTQASGPAANVRPAGLQRFGVGEPLWGAADRARLDWVLLRCVFFFFWESITSMCWSARPNTSPRMRTGWSTLTWTGYYLLGSLIQLARLTPSYLYRPMWLDG